MKKNEDCPICLDSLNNNTEDLPCNHTLHKKCIKNLIISNCPSNNKCPICRCPFINENNIILPPSVMSTVGDSLPIEASIQSPIESPIESLTSEHQRQIPLPLVQAMLFSLPNLN